MNLDSGLGDAFLDQERGDLQPLVALELDDLTSLLIINKGTVAGKFLHGVETENGQCLCSEAAIKWALAFLKAFKSFLRSYSAGKRGGSECRDRMTKDMAATNLWVGPEG